MRSLLIGSILVAGIVTAAAVTVAQAQAPDDTPAALARVYACAQQSNEHERLACYDAAVGRLRQAESGGEFVAVDRAKAEEVERDSFGFHLPSLSRILPHFGGGERAAASTATASAAAVAAPAAAVRNEDGQITQMQAVVQRVVDRANGRHAFYLSNGQIWAQTEAQRVQNVQPGTNVTVRRAMMGSFMLVSERGGAGHRVRREE